MFNLTLTVFSVDSSRLDLASKVHSFLFCFSGINIYSFLHCHMMKVFLDTANVYCTDISNCLNCILSNICFDFIF